MKAPVVRVNLYDRHHNIPLSYTTAIEITEDGQHQIHFTNEFDKINGKFIIGGIARRQSKDENAPVKKSGKKSLPIINNAAFVNAFLVLHNGYYDMLCEYPLEHMGYDNCIHDPGIYTQFQMPTGFTTSKSSIIFKCPDQVKKGEVVELTLFYVDPIICTSAQCNSEVLRIFEPHTY